MKWILVAALFGAYVNFAAAAESKIVTAESPTITALEKKWHFTIIKRFPTREPGLTGYVIKTSEGQKRLLFGMGAYVLLGPLFDADGNNATEAFATAELPRPDFAAAGKTLSVDPNLVSEGRVGAPEIFVFADPNCIFCHQFWQETRDWVKAGKLRIHWVMVGFLKESSAGKAAAMMAAKDGANAIAQDEMRFDKEQEEGAIKPLDPIPDDLKKALSRHSKMMAELGFSGTPSILFRDQAGIWQGKMGVPKKDDLPNALGFKP